MIANGFVKFFFPFRREGPLGHLKAQIIKKFLAEINEEKNLRVFSDAEGVFEGIVFYLFKEDGSTGIKAAFASRRPALKTQEGKMNFPVVINLLNLSPDR